MPVRSILYFFLGALVLLLLANLTTAAPTGPTIRLDYGHGTSQFNSISQFMYFVPLISAEPVTVVTNAGNSQSARVLSFNCRTNGNAFKATCQFSFVGDGSQENRFDHTQHIQRRLKNLQAGETLARQLSAINVQGSGRGAVEVSGSWTNGQPIASEVRLLFNQGQSSPVTVLLEDIVWRNGAAVIENETVARINALTFRRMDGRPKMEVALDSVKRKGASNSLWQNLMGSIKGSVANLFIPPLNIEAEGQNAMLDFGQALATQQPAFTFPFAPRLKKALVTGSGPDKIDRAKTAKG